MLPDQCCRIRALVVADLLQEKDQRRWAFLGSSRLPAGFRVEAPPRGPACPSPRAGLAGWRCRSPMSRYFVPENRRAFSPPGLRGENEIGDKTLPRNDEKFGTSLGIDTRPLACARGVPASRLRFAQALRRWLSFSWRSFGEPRKACPKPSEAKAAPTARPSADAAGVRRAIACRRLLIPAHPLDLLTCFA